MPYMDIKIISRRCGKKFPELKNLKKEEGKGEKQQ